MTGQMHSTSGLCGLVKALIVIFIKEPTNASD
jgi:hypothetical protein